MEEKHGKRSLVQDIMGIERQKRHVRGLGGLWSGESTCEPELTGEPSG